MKSARDTMMKLYGTCSVKGFKPLVSHYALLQTSAGKQFFNTGS